MKRLFVSSLIGVAATAAAMAQTPPAETAPPVVPPAAPPAVTAPPPVAPPSVAPVPGANSFTEGQVRSRLEANGYSDVTDLRKDDQGIWRGRAVYAGQPVEVAVDYQGNIARN